LGDVVEGVDDEAEGLGRAAFFGEQVDEFGDVGSVLADAGGVVEGVGLGGFEEGEEEGTVVFGEEVDGCVGVVGDEGFAFEGEEAFFRCWFWGGDGCGCGGGVVVGDGGGGVAGPEGAEVEVEVGGWHAVAGLKLGDHGVWLDDAVEGFGDEQADGFEGLGLQFLHGGGYLLGFGHAEEDEAGDVVGDGGDEVVF